MAINLQKPAAAPIFTVFVNGEEKYSGTNYLDANRTYERATRENPSAHGQIKRNGEIYRENR